MAETNIMRRCAGLVAIPGSVVCLALLMAGCSKSPEGNGGNTAGQVIAHMGNTEITAQELDNEFRLARIPPGKRDAAITRRVLGDLLERKYLVQQALAQKLDREPTVHLDILRSRDVVLADAMMQRDLAARSGTISKTEIANFIDAHPWQFAQRKIIAIDQIKLRMPADPKALEAATKNFKTLDQVDQQLKQMSIDHERVSGSLDSANLPDAFLTTLEAKKADNLFFVRTGQIGTFFKVTGEREEPIAGTDATNRATELLRLAMLKEASSQALQAATSAATYEGQYVKIMGQDKKSRDKTASPSTN